MRQYFHSGKLGDIVFSLPSCFELGCRTYNLIDQGQPDFWSYSPGVIAPLLERQGLEVRVHRGGGVVVAGKDWINGDVFRGRSYGRVTRPDGRPWNLAERHCLALGVSCERCTRAWLACDAKRVAAYVFCRSARYRPAAESVDWRAMVDEAKGDAVFLGGVDEHAAFETEYGVSVAYYATRDYLEAAEVIAGADLTVANQTGLGAVAAGLWAPLVLERCESIDCCVFGRPGEFLGSDQLLRWRHGRGRWPDDQKVVR